MCGRFTLRCPSKLLVEAFGLSKEPSLEPRYNVAPTQQVPIIRVLRTNPDTKERQLVRGKNISSESTS
jgi:putative SOS response-associated peptidase YedK